MSKSPSGVLNALLSWLKVGDNAKFADVLMLPVDILVLGDYKDDNDCINDSYNDANDGSNDYNDANDGGDNYNNANDGCGTTAMPMMVVVLAAIKDWWCRRYQLLRKILKVELIFH